MNNQLKKKLSYDAEKNYWVSGQVDKSVGVHQRMRSYQCSVSSNPSVKQVGTNCPNGM